MPFTACVVIQRGVLKWPKFWGLFYKKYVYCYFVSFIILIWLIFHEKSIFDSFEAIRQLVDTFPGRFFDKQKNIEKMFSFKVFLDVLQQWYYHKSFFHEKLMEVTFHNFSMWDLHTPIYGCSKKRSILIEKSIFLIYRVDKSIFFCQI